MGAYSNRVIADGASYYWRLGESSGLTAVAAVGGANGTISGGVTLGQPGAIADGSTAMAFNGTTGRIDTATPVTIPAAVTIEAWIYPTGFVTTHTLFSSRFTAGGLQLFVGTGTLACYSDGATPPQVTAAYAPVLNVWQHIVLVHTGALATFYVNGVNVFSGAQTRGAQTAIPVGIGSNPGGSNFFTGALDDVAIYPRALTAAEVSAHYAIGRTTEVGAQGPYADRVIADGASNYWRLNESSGSIARDIVGAKDGTISGGVTLGQPSPLSDGTSAMVFDGVDDKITTPAVTLLAPCTIEVWMKTTATVQKPVFCTLQNPASEDRIKIGMHDSQRLQVYVEYSGGAASESLGTTQFLNTGAWRHVVVVIAGPTIRAYIDGVLEPLNANLTNPFVGSTVHPVEIGFDVKYGYKYLGSLDEVAIYPRALSASEIAAHYALSTVPVPRDLNTGLYTYLLGIFGLSAATSYAERVKADGATNHWRLGETSGVTAVDAIGGANGTISGGVTLNQPSAMADGNGAMAFNGTTGKVVTAANVTIPAAATLEAWVKYVNDGSYQPILSLGVNQRPSLYIDAQASALVVFYDQVPNIALASLAPLSAGVWHQVVYTFTGSVGAIYIDGVLDKSAAYARPAASTDLGYLANDAAFGAVPNGFFNGSLDDVSIYPRALTAAEISAHYTLGRSGLSGGNDLTTLITRYLATLTGDMTARWKQMEKNAGF